MMFRQKHKSVVVFSTTLASALLVAIFIWGAYPGRFDGDSAGQYAQAVSGKVHDWHPLTLTALLAGLRSFGPGSGPAFLVQAALIFLACASLSSYAAIRHGLLGGVLVLACFASPIMLLPYADIQKDALLTVLTLLLCGCLLHLDGASGWPRVLLWVSAVGVSAIALDARTNAFILIVPFFLGASFALLQGGRRRRIALAFGLLLLACSITAGLRAAITASLAVAPVHAEQALLLFDIAGVTAVTGQDQSHGRAGADFLSAVERCYTPAWWDPFLWGACAENGRRFREAISQPEIRRQIIRDWMAMIISNPKAYLTHRGLHFLHFLRVRCDNCAEPMVAGLSYKRPYHDWIPDPDFPEDPPVNAVGLWLEAGANSFYASPFARGYPFLAALLTLTAVCLAIARRTADTSLSVLGLLGLSTILYTLASAVIGVASVFRYQHPLIMITMITAALITGSAIAAGHRYFAKRRFSGEKGGSGQLGREELGG